MFVSNDERFDIQDYVLLKLHLHGDLRETTHFVPNQEHAGDPSGIW